MNKHLGLRIALLMILVALGAYLFIYYDILRFFKDKDELILFIQSYRYNELVFILVQVIQVVVAVIPGEVSGFIGGYLYGPVWGTIYSTIGLTLGSWIAFMLARFFGTPLLEKAVKKEVFEKFEYFMEHKGLMVSFLLFLIPGFPKDYLCYILGLSRIPVWSFIIISTIGRVFGTAMLSVSGNVARKEQYVLLAFIVLVGVGVSVFAYFYREKILDLLKKKKPQ
jgi:uncharacterized membrane protein YdjX (TVP38/TMEM64 family)